MDPSHAKRKEAEILARRTRVVQLRTEGRTFREIAKELGVSVGLVHNDFDASIERVLEPNVAAYRAEHVARLHQMRAVVKDVLERRHLLVSASGRVAVDENEEPLEDDGVVLAATDRLLKIDEAERKLLGLDAKPELSVTGNLTYEILGFPDPAGAGDAAG